jgi:hypothetical protein
MRALYFDGSAETTKRDVRVGHGTTLLYPDRASKGSRPGPLDGSSVIWIYDSNFVASLDINIRLIVPFS